ncbi:AAA family ATPase [Sinorhizobium sp. 8-89]|uniref:AAA family ATPase n=1 Tax=Sinorhizobium sp. 7-81 TaxID=3049087 RepID=UPI0024C2A708|nr:AAA family ATPase [Sinorhizobium sp. 7-81]MDK1386529.1 AAA family ATPase [Sinorhizobium sp. 7-81]
MKSFDLEPGYDLEVLRADGVSSLVRLTLPGGQTNLAVLVAKPDDLAPAQQIKLETELRLTDLVASAGGAKALRGLAVGGRQGILLEDHGGSSLDSAWASGRPLKEFLQLSVSICDAVARIHEIGLVHGDIRPANIMVVDPGKVYFIGFGWAFPASRAPAVRDGDALTVDRLPYISPELTGRLDRRADTRSDLYSLGVTLYQLLTGRLPFAAHTPAEWLHSHLARPPLPPGRWATKIPSAVASILLKLLSKAAEERYQTVEGLRVDLEHCLSAFTSHGRIELFELGAQDARGTLVIPDQLYGREAEILRLTEILDRIAVSGKTELVLVSGSSGIGKSALVRAFQRRLDPQVALYAEGKFDQINHHVPLSTIVQAFRGLISHLPPHYRLGQDGIGDLVKAAIGPNGRLITSLIPELDPLVGPQSEVPKLPPNEAQHRFQYVLSRFAGAFSRVGHPLVLFLDDLQWIDHATLDFLKRTIRTQSIRNTLVIGAFRENEVPPGHPLREWLDEINQPETSVSTIELSPLSKAEVLHLVSDSLGVHHGEVHPLAEMVVEQAEGNPLFTTQLLAALVQDGRVAFDTRARQWTWKREEIEQSSSKDVSDLIAMRLAKLTPTTRDVISSMALLGNIVCRRLLCLVIDLPQDTYESCVDEAIEAGLIFAREEGLVFVHDRVQEAAYLAPSDETRRTLHLSIARRMISSMSPEEIHDRIFTVAEQYNRAIDLVAGHEERVRIAQLNLAAGRKAEQTSAFASALSYFEAGARIARQLGDEATELTVDFEIGMADCEFVLGQSISAERRLSALRQQTLDRGKLARVTWSQITLYTALGQLRLAIDLCLDYLRHEGIDWPANPTWDMVREEYREIEEEIRASAIETRLELPARSSTEAPILDVLGAVLPPAFFTDQKLVCLVLCRMANVSRANGNSPASPLGYAYLGMVLGPMFGEYAAGYRFGRLALQMVQDPAFARFRGRVSMTFAYHVLPYSEPIRAGRELHRQALTISQESGDLTYAGFCSCTTISNMLLAGDQLGVIERRASSALDFAKQINFGLIADIITSQAMLVRSLQGLTFSLETFDDGDFDEVAFESRLDSTPGLEIAACWHWIRKMQSAIFAGDFEAAVSLGKRAEPLLWTTAGHLEWVEYTFYKCLALTRTVATSDKPGMQEIREHAERLQTWSTNNPDNFAAYSSIALAELARLEARPIDALRHYEEAISASDESQFPHIEALTHEFAASFAQSIGLATMALAHRERAYAAYRRWGASGKLRDLEVKYPHLPTTYALSFSNSSGALPKELDLQSVVRSSASVAGEVVQSKMVRTLLTVALENAGAQRALLVLPKQQSFWKEAEAVANGEEIDVRFRREPLRESDAPARKLRDAFRHQEPVVLDDNELRHDLNMDENGISTGLAVPLVARGKSVGILLLENRLNENAFSPARIAVLKLIAAQAAISLENASLDEKESLLREVHHRVKNNLQLISSLLNLQASRVNDSKMAELFQDSRNRVRSMALVHENLYRAGNFARISMANHLKTLCAHLARAYGTREKSVALNVDVDEVDLDLDSAVSCGLIVNELVSNALKHAYPAVSRGQVSVALSVRQPTHYELVVEDDGAGLREGWESAETLGLQLVKDLVDQLRGSMTVETGVGTRFLITFKIAQA